MTTTRSIWIKSLVSGLLILLGSVIWASPRAGISVAVGILLALANFWLLERLVSGILNRQATSSKRLLLTFATKILILFGLIGLVVLKMPLDMAFFLLGLSCVVAGIVLEGLQGLFFGSTGSSQIAASGEDNDTEV